MKLKKKKIAFYIESMIVGGAEKVLIDLVNNLNADKFEIWVIAVFKKSVYSDYEFQFSDQFNSNINYTFLIDNTIQWKYKAFNFLFNNFNKKWIHKFLVKKKFDIEIAFYEGMPTEFVSNSAQKSKKIAWLHSMQERIYNTLSKDEIERKNKEYISFNLIIGVSSQVSESFKAFFSNQNPIIINNPIPKESIINKSNAIVQPFKEEIIKFITVGRLIKVKGYDRLLWAVNKCLQLGFNNFSLYMIGEGEEREKLEKFVFDNQIKNVNFLGFQQNPYPYMKYADALICSSYSEGFGNTLVEAMMLDTPVISTNCGGVTDIIDQESGFICENSKEGIFLMLKNVLENPKKILDLENVSIIVEKFIPEKIVCQIEKIFDSL